MVLGQGSQPTLRVRSGPMKYMSRSFAVLAAFAGIAGACGAVFAANGAGPSKPAVSPPAMPSVPASTGSPYGQLQYQVGTYILTQAAWDAIPAASKTNANLLVMALAGVASHTATAPIAIVGATSPAILRCDIALPVPGQAAPTVF